MPLHTIRQQHFLPHIMIYLKSWNEKCMIRCWYRITGWNTHTQFLNSFVSMETGEKGVSLLGYFMSLSLSIFMTRSLLPFKTQSIRLSDWLRSHHVIFTEVQTRSSPWRWPRLQLQPVRTQTDGRSGPAEGRGRGLSSCYSSVVMCIFTSFGVGEGYFFGYVHFECKIWSNRKKN